MTDRQELIALAAGVKRSLIQSTRQSLYDGSEAARQKAAEWALIDLALRAIAKSVKGKG